MKYVVLLYLSQSEFDARTGKDSAVFWASWKAYAEVLKNAGVLAGGSGLELPSTASTIRFEADDRTVQDGPYADTKEQLAGYCILDVPNLDAALEWAGRCPLKHGAVEVRAALVGE